MVGQLKGLASAIDDFRKARNQADLSEVLARFQGKTTQLLSFEDVRQKLRTQGGSVRGLRDIPLDAIVGSVGRYTDFTRDFLPRQEVNAERWARVKLAIEDLSGLPPIDVYQIGEVYFVKDGNHRVSVARQLGATHIQAQVTEVRTRVPLTPDVRPDDLIIKAEHATFLEQTRLDEQRPGADLTLSVPGQYQALQEHIAVHRYFMGIDLQRDVSYEEAVTHWYDSIYLPVINTIRERGILHNFPNRTEADLYLWIAEHRASLQKALGWEVNPETAADDLVNQFSPKRNFVVARLGEKLLEAIPLNSLETGPPPGQWRKEKQAQHRDDRLFSEVLVALSGGEYSWFALEQALVVAQREGAVLHGLHVTPDEASKNSEASRRLQTEFNLRCAQAGVQGELVLASGEVSTEICWRSRWTDLVVTNLAFPPPPQPLARLSSGFRELVQRCPRPIFATPRTTSALKHGLLAYDGSSKAEEALFVATYIAGQWQIPLVVVTVLENGSVTEQTQEQARQYLEMHKIQATYILAHGQASGSILQTAEEHGCDFLLMGGYGYNVVLETVLGSVVDQVLRESRKPMLICR